MAGSSNHWGLDSQELDRASNCSQFKATVHPQNKSWDPGQNRWQRLWKRPIKITAEKMKGTPLPTSIGINQFSLLPTSIQNKNPVLSTYIAAEMNPIIAVDLVWGPHEHRVNNEFVVSPLEVTPTFLMHSDSFTLEGWKWNQTEAYSKLITPDRLTLSQGSE